MKFNIQATHIAPIYQQLKDGIEEMISNNSLTRGQVLPKASEIARINNIPESEVVRAYHELVIAGTLSKSQRKNLFGDNVVEYTIN
ncbi:MAG: GntR family transcriptional regulator [Blastocatellia bacterium]|nr:GntR family transcriptional regulator [Blastocatellia bacterium]